MSDTLAPDDELSNAGEPSLAPVVRRAHRRFKRCAEFERTARANWLNDYKFAFGDAYNNYQWPTDIYKDRGARPSLTVNETHAHNLHIINEAKQNKASVKYRPTGGEATAEAAEVREGLYRHIANVSNAQMAQGKAIEFQVHAGLGFTIIEAHHVDVNPKPGPEAFEQEIRIVLDPNPMGTYLDCDCKEPDGTGARYGFRFSDEPKDAILEEYPELRGKLNMSNAVDGDDSSAGWIRENHVRVARYYEVEEEKDELLGDENGTVVMKSDVPPKLLKSWEAEEAAGGAKLKRREVIRKRVTVYKIVGDQVVDEAPLPGTCVPIVPWVGEVTFIDNILDRRGHTRSMLDSQRMLNYNWSASVEFGALQSKSPWVAPVAAIGDYMTYYSTANTENHAVLPYVHRDEEGREIPKPERQQPPTSAPVYLEGVAMARQFMMAASGQYEADLGKQGNERSGRAINERQRMGDRANYHFIDNQALAIRRQGVIVNEWMPYIYDTKRVAQIIGIDDEEEEVQIDPSLPEAHQIKGEGEAIQRIFNPRIGSYEVVSDVGPDYATQRQEAFNAIVQILKEAPELVAKIGDLLFKVADFPLADKIAERLKPGLAPEAQQAITALQEQLQKAEQHGQNTQKLLSEAMQALSEERLRVKAKDSDNTIDAFDADTKRLAVVKDMIPMDPEAMQALVMETVRQALQDNLGPIVGQLKNGILSANSPEGPPGASGQLPIRVSDPGEAAAMIGGA